MRVQKQPKTDEHCLTLHVFLTEINCLIDFQKIIKIPCIETSTLKHTVEKNDRLEHALYKRSFQYKSF